MAVDLAPHINEEALADPMLLDNLRTVLFYGINYQNAATLAENYGLPELVNQNLLAPTGLNDSQKFESIQETQALLTEIAKSLIAESMGKYVKEKTPFTTEINKYGVRRLEEAYLHSPVFKAVLTKLSEPFRG